MNKGILDEELLMVEIVSYAQEPPAVIARFWWSSERGLTCDRPLLVELLKQEGLAVPDNRVVYPSDGRAFFDALPFGFNGLERAQPPIVVDHQGGEAA